MAGEEDSDYQLVDSYASHNLLNEVKKSGAFQTTLGLFEALLDRADNGNYENLGVVSPSTLKFQLQRRQTRGNQIDLADTNFDLLPRKISFEDFLSEVDLIYHERAFNYIYLLIF